MILLEVSPRRRNSARTRRRGFLGYCSLLILFVVSIQQRCRAQEPDVCTPGASVQAGLDALPKQTPEETDWGFHEKEVAAIQLLMRQQPDDIFVQGYYIRAMGYPTERQKIIEEYKRKLAESGGSARMGYLYGLTLIGRQSAESIELLESALQKDPKFPWPHLGLVELYATPAFQDRVKADTHIKAFLDACPASFDGYQSLARFSDNKDIIRDGMANLRRVVEKRDDIHAVAAYQTLWDLEYKGTAQSEYEALRKKTAADVQRIRGLNLIDKKEWYETLEEGYKLANDPKSAAWAKDEKRKRYPSPWAPASYGKWSEDHKYPGEDAPAEARRAYYTDLLAQANKWVEERPNSTVMWFLRLDALSQLEGVSSTQIETAADQLFAVLQRNAGPPGLMSRDYFDIARTLSRKHLQPGRVLMMAQRGQEQAAIEQKDAYDLYDDQIRSENRFYEVFSNVEGVGLIAGAYIELKQPDKAQVTLGQMDERLQDLKSAAGEKKDRQRLYLGKLSGYWRDMARLAVLQERKLDAMAFYQNALLARLDAGERDIPGETDELAGEAKKLWTSLGGTEQAWTMWYGRRANELARSAGLRWDETNEPLAAFELADVNGKMWNLEALKGKTTFLNFWASW